MTTVLFTPPLSIQTANTAKYDVYLNVLNASSTARNGTLEIINLNGTQLAYGGYNNVAAGGGTGIQVQNFQTTAQVTLIYGKVTVDDTADSIRANLSLVDAKGNALVSVDAY